MHQNLVAALSLEGDDLGATFLVLAHRAEPTLRDVLQAGPLPPLRAVQVALDVAQAIEVMAAERIVHRDIKPENILLAEHGARLTGLGMAQLPDETLRRSASPVHPGTPAYMSPEQATSQAALDARSDLYALGAVLYEMLSGVRHRDTGAPLGLVSPGLPSALVAIVDRLLQPSPEKRFSGAEGVIAALSAVQDQRVLGQAALVLGQLSAQTALAGVAVVALFLLAFSVNALGRRLEMGLAASAASLPTVTMAYGERDALISYADGRGLALLVPTSEMGAASLRAPAVQNDPYEPDEDVPAALSLWEVQRRAFDAAGDVDRAVFLVRAGQTYVVTTSNLAVGVDTLLEVHVDGVVLANDDLEPGTMASQVTFTAQADGTAQVTVRNQDRYGPDRTYDLSLLLGDAGTAPEVERIDATESAPARLLTPLITPIGTDLSPGAGATLTPRPTLTPYLAYTRAPVSTLAATATRRPTWTRVPTWTRSPTLSRTPTLTPTVTGTLSATPTATETLLPTATNTATPTPAPTNLPTLAHTPLPPAPTGPPAE